MVGLKSFVTRYLSWALFVATFGLLVASYAGPHLISILFTPPVSFGINCEPAADWAMSKLLLFQFAGFILGSAGGVLLGYRIAKRQGRAVTHEKAN